MIDNLAFKVYGVDELAHLARNVAPGLAKNALRSALGQSATLLLQIARPLVPQTTREATGLLRRSLGKKDSKPQERKIYSVVGPRRGFKMYIRPKTAKKRRGKLTRQGGYRLGGRGREKNPIRYAHLVEKGHKLRNGGMVRGRPFLMAAKAQAAGQIKDRVQRVLIERLVKEMKFDAGTGA